jgi:hypothetical protein
MQHTAYQEPSRHSCSNRTIRLAPNGASTFMIALGVSKHIKRPTHRTRHQTEYLEYLSSASSQYIVRRFGKQYKQTIGLDFFIKRIVLPGEVPFVAPGGPTRLSRNRSSFTRTQRNSALRCYVLGSVSAHLASACSAFGGPCRWRARCMWRCKYGTSAASRLEGRW